MLSHERTAKEISDMTGRNIKTVEGWKRRALISQSDDHTPASKRTRKGAMYPDVEEQLLIFFRKYRSDGYISKIMLNGPILREKALNIARNLGHSDFLASVGWLAKFRERCDICSIKLHGEGGSCPREISESSRKSLQALTADYQPNLIFNADESALFYRQLPNKGFVFLNEAKSRQLRGYDEMSSKDRLTLHLCTNSDGSLRVPMLIIGQSKSPLSLRVSYNINQYSFYAESRASSKYLLPAPNQLMDDHEHLSSMAPRDLHPFCCSLPRLQPSPASFGQCIIPCRSRSTGRCTPLASCRIFPCALHKSNATSRYGHYPNSQTSVQGSPSILARS